MPKMVKVTLGDKAEQEIRKIPLSNYTIQRRIIDLSDNIEQSAMAKLVSSLYKSMNLTSATLWHLAGFGDFRKKNSSFWLPYQRPSSADNCTRELFNGSNGSASLVDCTRKKFFAWGWGFFVSDVISGGLLGHLGPLCLALGANC